METNAAHIPAVLNRHKWPEGLEPAGKSVATGKPTTLFHNNIFPRSTFRHLVIRHSDFIRIS